MANRHSDRSAGDSAMARAHNRLRTITGHFADADRISPDFPFHRTPPAGDVLSTQPASASLPNPTSSSYASATGKPSSYARIHGEVSRAPAKWRNVDELGGQRLEDVLYHKAEGEGIAKVGWSTRA